MKPLHFIDTSVILEAFSEDGKYREECKSYLNTAGYKFIGFLSLSVLGEILVVINNREKEAKELFIGWLHHIIKRKKIKLIVPRFEVLEIIKRLKEADYKIEFVDALHLSTAIENNANAFVTLDEKLVGNIKIEKEFKIKILHPKQI
jgi:predicted nucleic acid-binding protein